MGFHGKNENQFCTNQFHLLIQEFFSYGIDDLNFKIGILFFEFSIVVITKLITGLIRLISISYKKLFLFWPENTLLQILT